jgi:hypothetical protein
LKGGNMNQQDIEQVMLDALGNPESGQVKDHIPLLAAAVDAALNPKPAAERRVVKPEETR